MGYKTNYKNGLNKYQETFDRLPKEKCSTKVWLICGILSLAFGVGAFLLYTGFHWILGTLSLIFCREFYVVSAMHSGRDMDDTWAGNGHCDFPG